jgi:hypothetical protein
MRKRKVTKLVSAGRGFLAQGEKQRPLWPVSLQQSGAAGPLEKERAAFGAPTFKDGSYHRDG